MRVTAVNKPYVSMVILDVSVNVEKPEDLHVEHNTLYAGNQKLVYCIDTGFLIEMRNSIVTALKSQDQSFSLNEWADTNLKARC